MMMMDAQDDRISNFLKDFSEIVKKCGQRACLSAFLGLKQLSFRRRTTKQRRFLSSQQFRTSIRPSNNKNK
jgi:hypothetical protein